MVRNQLREQQAINTNTNGGGAGQQQQQQQQQRSMMPAPGLPPNLTSCRLEARQELTGSAPNKTMEIQKIAQVQNTDGGGGGTVYMEDNDIEAVDPPALAIDSKVASSAYPTSSIALVEDEEEEEEEEVAMAITNVDKQGHHGHEHHHALA